MLCGDMNVTRSDVDVHPKERQPNLIGQRPEERELFEKLGEHLADVGRTLDPDNPNRFTWWAPWRNLRQRNIGWRIASPAIAGHAASCAALADWDQRPRAGDDDQGVERGHGPSLAPRRKRIDDRVDPARQSVQHFGSHVRILASRAGWHMKGMIGVRIELQCRAGAELFDEPLHEWQVRKLIAGSLQEQHRDLDVEQVFAALVRRPPGGMQRESE